MTDKRISELDALTGANTASDDVFIITDTSTGVSKKITRAELNNAMEVDPIADIEVTGGTINGAAIGGTTPAAGAFTTVDASGAITGDLTGDVTGDLTGDVTAGDVTVSGTVDFAPQSSHPAHDEGLVWYDNIHKTLNYYSDITNVIHEIGIEEHQRVYNNTGSTITAGSPLYFSGNYTAGAQDVPTVGLANATDVNKYNAQGLAAADIANNSYGYCIVAGQVDGIDTSALSAGQNFFVGLTDGSFQNASPTYPNFPMCLGWVVKSDASDGVLLVNQQNHSVNSFRVRTDAHIGNDLIVDGDLTVVGTQVIASTANVELGAAYQYLNAGDTIGESGTTFTGTGLDDAFLSGHFSGTATTTYYVRIDGTGTPDTFEWSKDNFSTTVATGVSITGGAQTLDNGIEIDFGATTGHTSGDVWSGTAAPAEVDTGIFTNRNTGGSGVGYTHMGIFFDVSESKWTLLDEYDPEPDGTIDLTDASVSYGAFKAGAVESESLNSSGDLTVDTDTLYVDTTNDRVGVNNVSPSVALDVTGDATVSGTATADVLALDNTAGDWTFEVSGDNLIIKYGGTSKAKLDTSGNLTVVGNVTAYGTI